MGSLSPISLGDIQPLYIDLICEAIHFDWLRLLRIHITVSLFCTSNMLLQGSLRSAATTKIRILHALIATICINSHIKIKNCEPVSYYKCRWILLPACVVFTVVVQLSSTERSHQQQEKGVTNMWPVDKTCSKNTECFLLFLVFLVDL